jgi:spore photoproduct lyase
MQAIDAIRALLYFREDRDNTVVRRFRESGEREIIECDGEEAMDSAIRRLRGQGISSKETVILKKFQGRMFQKCPGSPGMICCNYYLVNIGFNCPYNCTYCYLNYYLNSYGITQFINPEISFDAIGSLVREDPEAVFRVGTGEYTDSLVLDDMTGFSASLIAAASGYRNLFLELKTKSDNIGHLLDIEGKGNTVLAWSLNTPRNIALYEAGAVSLERRITAAAAACSAGYLTAFHFDPMIMYDGWIGEYRDVVDLLFDRVRPDRIAWISLGCFRYSPGFREIIREAFPGQGLTADEMFPGPDGKFRYLKKERAAAYSALLERIRSRTDKPFVYLCMETESLWYDLFNTRYHSSRDLELAFGAHLKRHFL